MGDELTPIGDVETSSPAVAPTPEATEFDEPAGEKSPPQPLLGAGSTSLPPEILNDIELLPKQRGITAKEREAYYAALAQAAATDETRLQTAARRFEQQRRNDIPQLAQQPDAEFPVFVDLFKNPELYHGKAVSLSGHVRKIRWFPAGANEVGLNDLYEVWLYPEHSQSNPAVIICSEIPTDFPLESELVDHVSVTGYFLKMYIFRSQDDNMRMAPMIVAHRLRWNPELAVTVMKPLPRAAYWIAGIVVVMLILIVVQTNRRDRRLRNAQQQREISASSPDFSQLGVPDSSTSAFGDIKQEPADDD